MTRDALRFGRLLPIWAPLAATYLLVTGSMPIVNASINRLPGRDHETDLAAFAVFLACAVVIHSPLFVTREIAIKLSVDRAGARRALRFCLGAGAVMAAFELLLGATPLGAWVLGAFSDRPAVIGGAHRTFLVVWPVPILVAVRGVYQAHQIRVDDTLFVGLGTLVRLIFTGIIGLLIAPHIGVSGPILGGLCMVFGITVETVFAYWRARARARPPERSDDQALDPWKFGLPLMLANLLALGGSLFILRIVGLVPADAEEHSLAAYQEVRTLHWLLTAATLALQPLSTAKVRADADGPAMLRFGAVTGGALSVLFGLIVFTPLRDWVLVDVLNEEPGGQVVAMAGPALLIAVPMPFLNGVRFALRGILIARGSTRAITGANVTTVVLLASAIAFGLLPFERNGVLNAYIIWTVVLLVEIGILIRLARGAPDGGLPAPVRTAREASGG